MNRPMARSIISQNWGLTGISATACPVCLVAEKRALHMVGSYKTNRGFADGLESEAYAYYLKEENPSETTT